MSSDHIALALALILPPIVVAVFRTKDAPTPLSRFALWAVAVGVIVGVWVADGSIGDTMGRLGLDTIRIRSVVFGVAGAAVLMLAAGLVMAAQRAARLAYGDRDSFARLVARPLSHRVLVVLTAAVVEEVLYRGVGIGIGRDVFSGPLIAAAVSTLAFTAAHFRWQVSHLPAVAVSGLVLSGLYIVSGDLWACILAHLLVDAAGLLIAPAAMARAHAKPRP